MQTTTTKNFLHDQVHRLVRGVPEGRPKGRNHASLAGRFHLEGNSDDKLRTRAT